VDCDTQAARCAGADLTLTRICRSARRFPEELARHKILDILGDFYLLGAPLRAEIHARKTGHSHNVAMVRRIREMLRGADA